MSVELERVFFRAKYIITDNKNRLKIKIIKVLKYFKL